MQIKKGEFICIIGEVGCGKSSLINAILGDMIYINDETLKETSLYSLDHPTRDLLCQKCNEEKGIVKLGGSVSLVQQNPWILNRTIRDNITFGLPLDEDRYNDTIEICQLESDLDIFKGGDLTEIGEKGINLSGGQKARISLARAVYADNDIILMDDPISALDSHVKQKIFEEVFCDVLKDKTRILVTHAIDYAHLADRIIVMEEGKMKFFGSYDEINKNPELTRIFDMISLHLKKQSNSDDGPAHLSHHTSSHRNHMSHKGTHITTNENLEESENSLSLYSHLLVSQRSWILGILIIALYIANGYVNTRVNYYYGVWIKNSEDPEVYWDNLYYALFNPVTQSLLISVICIMMSLNVLRKSKKVHQKMLEKTMNAPINLYFDKTPSGQILNRFSNDINNVDTVISW